MFEFLFVIGIVLAFYGYSTMKNPRVWGDQGREEIRPENWNGYVVHNGQFMMYAGFFLAALAALDVIFTFANWLFILILLGGLALLFYPLAHWMHEKEGKWWPWPRHKRKIRGLRMAFDFKKEYKEFYLPKTKPALVTVPPMNYLAVRGKGDPNEENGAYQQAIGLLYGVAYTIKMSKKGDHRIEGYFDYVVPPLEGFWQQEGTDAIDYAHKERFVWVSVIRLPDFVTKADFAWAVQEAAAKKKQDFSAVEFLTVEEGLCVQCMHIGPYDREPETVAAMDAFWQPTVTPMT